MPLSDLPFSGREVEALLRAAYLSTQGLTLDQITTRLVAAFADLDFARLSYLAGEGRFLQRAVGRIGTAIDSALVSTLLRDSVAAGLTADEVDARVRIHPDQGADYWITVRVPFGGGATAGGVRAAINAAGAALSEKYNAGSVVEIGQLRMI